jgi:hypothetical protein
MLFKVRSLLSGWLVDFDNAWSQLKAGLTATPIKAQTSNFCQRQFSPAHLLELGFCLVRKRSNES